MRLLQNAQAMACLLLACAAAASPQATLRHKTFRDFQAGEPNNVAVLGTGALELGPRLRPYEPLKPQAFVWALVADSKGRVFAATGNGGKVFVLTDGKAEVALDTDDLEVLSLAVDPDDNVYAACAPSGKIYRIPPKGKPTLFCETKQTYVWALAITPKRQLYAGTGPDGKILQIGPNGKTVKTVYDSAQKHILSLAAAGDTVYAGTDRDGLVYRIAPDGRVSIAFDAASRELRCMAADDKGNVYFGSADGLRATATTVPRRVTTGKTAPAKAGGMAKTLAVKKAPHTSKRPPAYVPSTRPGSSGVSGSNYVYRLAADGKVSVVLKMTGVAFLSMAWHQGALYAGSAGEGKVFRVLPEADMGSVASVDQPQALSLCILPSGKLFVGTANDGRVYAGDSLRAMVGTYVSSVYDARSRSRWGALHIEGRVPKGTRVEACTRTGNSAKPDNTWSRWSKHQQIDTSAPITSPAARFIQYRLALSTRDVKMTPRIREVSFPYLPDNRAPSVDSIDIAPAGAAQAAAKKTSSRDRRPPPQHGDGCISRQVTISWRAQDPDRDLLLYTLHFRGKGEKNWKLLAEDLTATSRKWQTDAVPDGAYELKVTASDRPGNPRPRDLSDELVSEPVTVDNSPPLVRVTGRALKDGRCSVGAEAKDAGSNIRAARYSVDAGRWEPVLPIDEIFDARMEKLILTTEALGPGEHTLVIQAEDSAGNVGSSKAVFEVLK